MTQLATDYRLISQNGEYQLVSPTGRLVGTYWTILAAYDASHQDAAYNASRQGAA